MRRDLRAFEPEALPHWDSSFVELAESCVRREYSLRAHLDDVALRAERTPVRARQASAVSYAERSVAERGEAAGLVSVLSTGKREALSAECSAAESYADGEALKRSLGAFVVDVEAKRRSKLRMAVGFAARAHAVSMKGSRNDKPWMVTLTYRPGVSWQPGHVKEAIRHMRNWCARNGFPLRYVWIAEMQDGKRRADGVGRDVIHYHLAVWLPARLRCPHFDSRGWWPYGMSQSKRMTHATGYLMSYFKKDKELGSMPRGARAYGVGGLDHSLRRARRWLRLPRFVQGNSSIDDDWQRTCGGGWTAPDGSRWESEFQAINVGPQRCLVRVRTHALCIEASGPFSWREDSPWQ